MGYSLDRQENITITGNTTITGLTNGLHNITVYAKDKFENMGASETIYFNVTQPEPTEPKPPEAPLFTTTDLTIIAAVAVTVIIGIGFLAYFKKGKH
jgi:hypothetical protein